MESSLIRLRQLNTSDLSGFIQSVFFPSPKSGLIMGGNINPSGSGISNLGTSLLPFNNLYANQLNLSSGINFGGTSFYAYTSGNEAYIQVGGYTISSTPNGISIVGPSGALGPSGAIGLSGASVTGAVTSGNHISFIFSNGVTGNSILLPSGATGAQGPSGASITGLLQISGTGLSPLYSNGTTGVPFYIPSGAQGAQGIVGGINLGFDQFTGVFMNDVAPEVIIYNIDPNGSTNPDISLVRGMTYQFNYSGLNTISSGDFSTNYFVESGITGYLKFVVFDKTITDYTYNDWTGRITRLEIDSLNSPSQSVEYANLTDYLKVDDVFYNITEDSLRMSRTFTVRLGSSANSYRYGFQKYNFADQSPMDDSQDWGFYELGDLNISYFGPAGPAGSNGPVGEPGPAGNDGAQGDRGPTGISVVNLQRDGNSIRFILSNGNTTSWLDLPTGGPSGIAGPQGLIGPSGGIGPQGNQGAVGIADRYAAEFYITDTYVTGLYGAIEKQTAGVGSYSTLTGNNRIFTTGDYIRFQADDLIGKSYSTWQKLLLSDTPSSRGQYFYATVNDYNSGIGQLSLIITNNPTPIGTSANNILWYNYNEISLNLGGLGSSGAAGPTGATGPSGSNAVTGYNVFNINPLSGLVSGNFNTINFNPKDGANLNLVGPGTIIQFDYTQFLTGQVTIMRIKNSSSFSNTNDPPLILWDTYVKFPFDTPAPAPNSGMSSIYSFVRFPNEGGNPLVFCTYSTSYDA